MAGVSKRLSCPRCGQVMAAAVFRVFGGLRITTPDGVLLAPVTGDLLLTIGAQAGFRTGSHRPPRLLPAALNRERHRPDTRRTSLRLLHPQ